MTMQMQSGEDLLLETADRRKLRATLYEPARSNGIAVQINSATLVPRNYYKAFAEFLAGRGFAVLTYDCRAIVANQHDLRHETSGVLDWGRYDQLAASAALRARFPAQRFAIVAHSLGGQILGLSPRSAEANAVLLLTSAHGYWRRWSALRQLGTAWHMRVIVPLQIALFGYAPRGLGPGLPLSAPAARDFVRFQRHPAFFCDAAGQPLRPHNDEIRMPLRHITFSDDEVVPPGSEIDLGMFYPNADWRHDHKTPQDYGAERVGHFGFFRRSMPKAAWEDAAQWLEQAVAR